MFLKNIIESQIMILKAIIHVDFLLKIFFKNHANVFQAISLKKPEKT